jgi:hypothetical protein
MLLPPEKYSEMKYNLNKYGLKKSTGKILYRNSSLT